MVVAAVAAEQHAAACCFVPAFARPAVVMAALLLRLVRARSRRAVVEWHRQPAIWKPQLNRYEPSRAVRLLAITVQWVLSPEAVTGPTVPIRSWVPTLATGQRRITAND